MTSMGREAMDLTFRPKACRQSRASELQCGQLTAEAIVSPNSSMTGKDRTKWKHQSTITGMGRKSWRLNITRVHQT